MTNESINKHLGKFMDFLLFKVVALLVVVFLVITVPMSKSNAATVFYPFGGRVTSVILCTCSANFQITVFGPKGGVFMIGPGTIPYGYYFPSIGRQIKGITYPTYVPCLQFVAIGCAPGGPGGLLIQKYGTSLR